MRRRVIVLAAAYVIALSSVIASFGAAQAAAEAINQTDGVLCHSSAAVGQPAPLADKSNSKICVESCCIGCLAMAAAVPPRVLTAAVPHSLSQRFAPLTCFILIGGVDFNAPRSRGPPPAS